ncbi:hypothetical protein [Cytobacillus sp. BC1816]|uniref:hypothetical protein n=1 Tax=Cytobacillus sp. BC1816 TaxID=3440154 RepID=UPI003F50EA10
MAGPYIHYNVTYSTLSKPVSFSFFSHPCHPPVFNDETTEEASRDCNGGIKASRLFVRPFVIIQFGG